MNCKDLKSTQGSEQEAGGRPGKGSAEPGGVQLGLLLDARVHLQHFANGHGGVGRRRERKIHLQSSVFAFCQAREKRTVRKGRQQQTDWGESQPLYRKEITPLLSSGAASRGAAEGEPWK